MLKNKIKINKKTAVTIVIVLIFVGLIAFFSLLRDRNDKTTSIQNIGDSEKIIQKVPTPTEKTKKTPPMEVSVTSAYFYNTIGNVKKPVTGYSWMSGKLIYSTEKGIYIAGKNEVIKEISIDFINWSKNGKSIIRSKNKWYFLDSSNRELKELKNNLKNPVISPIGDKLFEVEGSVIKVIDTFDENIKTKELNSEITSAFWSDKGNLIAIQNKTENENKIIIIDSDLNENENFTTNLSYNLSSISPNGDSVILYGEKEIIIYNLSDIGLSLEIEENSKIISEWMNDNTFIFSQTSKDYIGRTINNIYKCDSKGNREFLNDSRPIISRLNTSIKMSTNEEDNLLPLIDNEGNIWLLALLKNKIPLFTEEGPVFSTTHNKGI